MPIEFTDLIQSHANEVRLCTAESAAGRIRAESDLVVLDVREPAEFASGSVSGAVNVPRGFLEFKIAEVCSAADPPILIHCKSGGRAVLAAKTLADMGYSNVEVYFGAFEDLVAAMG
ncbi:MAG: rhodanese-like domain-containing protein [bacterium]|nr:rhodanese-like domain-containing protein [bacterium]MCP5068842.1 rhodanese-like domain-containing protein [bacterium]